MVVQLQAPGVSVSVDDQSGFVQPGPTTIPLIVLATRANKTVPAATSTGAVIPGGIAPGTQESNVLRLMTGQRQVIQTLGNPVFNMNAGLPIAGDETNEVGLWSLWSAMAGTSQAYYLRANIDLGQLVPSAVAPLGPPLDQTYWINPTNVIGGVYRRNAANSAWVAQVFHVFIVTPGAGTGAVGDFGFDYSTTNGTLVVKINSSTWQNVGATNFNSTTINGLTSATSSIWISPTAPTGAGSNDYWWDTAPASGGCNLGLQVYSAANATFSPVTVNRQTVAPANVAGVIWEDISLTATNGVRPLKIADGLGNFSLLTVTINSVQPSTSPPTGTLWFNNSIADFAMYQASGSTWFPITTVTGVNNPTALQKVISASAPTLPSVGAIWVDVGIANIDKYPVINRWNGVNWEGITASVLMQDSDPGAGVVLNGTYWINLGDTTTTNLLKAFNSSYASVVVNAGQVTSVTVTAPGSGYTVATVSFSGGGASIQATGTVNISSNQVQSVTINTPGTGYTSVPTVTISGNGSSASATAKINGVTAGTTPWQPNVGSTFGRRGVRLAVSRALKATINANQDILANINYYQLIAVPGYPELYDDMVNLNETILEKAFIVADTPKYLIASGVEAGQEVTANDWKNNTFGALSTGEQGFTSAGYPYAALYYPWGLGTNIDGNQVVVPPSAIALRTIMFNDNVGQPWFAPMGTNRGLVANVSSVGFVDNTNTFNVVSLNTGQQAALYNVSINPIVNFPGGVGLRVWGQKTNYGINSALNRINVARLIIKMKYDLSNALQPLIGEPNDATTQGSAANLVNRYMAGLRSLRAVYDYAVRCDSSNNTPDRVAANELWVDIAISPTKAVEFIYVPILIVAPGQPLGN